MKKIKTSDIVDPNISQPITGKSLTFLQDGTQEAIQQVSTALIGGQSAGGSILWGCVETDLGGGNFSCTAGAIISGPGEIYLVDEVVSVAIGSSSAFKVAITNDPTADPLTFTDGVARNVHNIRKALYTDLTTGPGDLITVYSVLTRADKTLEKVIEIGAWDMDATASLNIAHGVTPSKITSLDVMIINDGGGGFTDKLDGDPALSGQAQGYASVFNTFIKVSRLAAGFFDSATFNDTGINRGYITIRYTL